MSTLLTADDVEEILGRPFATTAEQCHVVSLAIVRSGRFPGARVARGFTKHCVHQHSWVVIGDPYGDRSPIIDATLWSYTPKVEGVWHGTLRDGVHVPHGHGSIWTWGKPEPGAGEPIELTPRTELSPAAQTFLELLGPLDRQGWATLSSAPVLGWPAGEIFAAMADTPRLSSLVKVDILGMTTDRNPGGLYR